MTNQKKQKTGPPQPMRVVLDGRVFVVDGYRVDVRNQEFGATAVLYATEEHVPGRGPIVITDEGTSSIG